MGYTSAHHVTIAMPHAAMGLTQPPPTMTAVKPLHPGVQVRELPGTAGPVVTGLRPGWDVPPHARFDDELRREGRLGAAGAEVGRILRDLAPEATSALVDLIDGARLHAVFAGDDELGMPGSPFDTETLGEADEVLRQALRGPHDVCPEDLAASGWEHVHDSESTALYRIAFPPPPTDRTPAE